MTIKNLLVFCLVKSNRFPSNFLLFCNYHVLYLLLGKVLRSHVLLQQIPLESILIVEHVPILAIQVAKIPGSLVDVPPPTWILCPTVVCCTFNISHFNWDFL